MKMIGRTGAAVLALLMFVPFAMMTGCQNKIPLQENEPFEFPYREHVELSWWRAYDRTYYGDAFTKLEDHPYMRRMEEETNVHVTFVEPTADSLAGMRTELESMIAAGTVCDMVSQTFFAFDFQGNTLDAAIDEEVYLPLNELIDVQMPNFKGLMDEYSIIEKVIRTPQQNIIFLPLLTNVERPDSPTNTTGILIRKDFLDELQLDVPVTVDDWETTLLAFQTMGVEMPFVAGSMPYAATMQDQCFITCYDQAYNLYIDKKTGKLKEGTIQDGMKSYVTNIRRWVEEGLMFIADADKTKRASNDVGAWCGNVNDVMNLKDLATDANYQLVACPDPVLHEGDRITIRGDYRPIGVHTIGNVYLSWTCSQPAIAAKWLDQMYSDEKYMEASYGVLGEDYNLDENGKVVFTDKILNNPLGVRYGLGQNTWLDSYWRDPDVMIDYAYTPEAKAACEVWGQATYEYSMVAEDVLFLTQEESDSLEELGNFWMLYTGWLLGFVNGSRSITEWDEFIEQMHNQGIEERTEIFQNAYDRYLAG